MMSLIEKLSPGHVRVSGKFTAILGCILDQAWTDPRLVALYRTSDDILLGQLEGDVGANEMLGTWDDLQRNLAGVADAVSLTSDERLLLGALMRRSVKR